MSEEYLENSEGTREVNFDDEKDYYPHSFAFAKENGEVDQFRLSNRKNRECASVIDNAITDCFDGMHLEAEVIRPVLKRFCPDRISHVLAETIIYAIDDGRISRDNKEWAMQINPDQEPNRYEEHLVILESHPYVLNGFIDLYRKELPRIDSLFEERAGPVKEAAEPDMEIPTGPCR